MIGGIIILMLVLIFSTFINITTYFELDISTAILVSFFWTPIVFGVLYYREHRTGKGVES